ncbi:hypothetical protein [Nocardia sp. CA-135398]|uniref:hypothetical protein n=1 Tax=Nocardia sp. CA-135398 TaxID=3239977 RepID=UPI003D991562
MDDIELQPPSVVSEKDTGLVLDIAAVGLHNPLGLAGEPTYAYVRCTDDTTYRLPAPLQEWATSMIAVNHVHRAAGHQSLFPGQIEFGILNGGMYAELL